MIISDTSNEEKSNEKSLNEEDDFQFELILITFSTSFHFNPSFNNFGPKCKVDLIKTYCRLVVQKETTPFFRLTEFWSSSKEFTLRNFLRGFGQ